MSSWVSWERRGRWGGKREGKGGGGNKTTVDSSIVRLNQMRLYLVLHLLALRVHCTALSLAVPLIPH